MAGKKPESILLRLLAVPMLVFLGAVFLLGALLPGCRDLLDRWFGEDNFIYFGIEKCFIEDVFVQNNHMYFVSWRGLKIFDLTPLLDLKNIN